MLSKALLAGFTVFMTVAASSGASGGSRKGNSTEERFLSGDEIRRAIAGYVLITPPVETAPVGEAFYPDGTYRMFADWISPIGHYTIHGRTLCVYVPRHEARCRQVMQTKDGIVFIERMEGRVRRVPVERRPLSPEH